MTDSHRRHWLSVAFAIALVACLPNVSRAQDLRAAYARAEQFLTWNALRMTAHDQVAPTFYRDSTRFWYRVMTPAGAEFVTVNPALGTKAPLFDAVKLAVAMSTAADTAYDPAKLPFRTFEFDKDGRDEKVIRITAGKRGLTCDIVAYRCTKSDTLANRTALVRSPDDKWDAFVSSYNVWLRPATGGDSIQLTTDGTNLYAYGLGMPSVSVIRNKIPQRPQLSWSPDSRRIAVVRFDERNVPLFHVYSSTTSRPTDYAYPYAIPGDTIVPHIEPYVIDVAAKSAKRVNMPAQSAMSFYVWGATPLDWGAGSDRLYVTHVDRGPKHVRLMEVDASTGEAKQLIADSSATYLTQTLEISTFGQNFRVLKSGDVIWFSERDGFGHLYRFGKDGALKSQITNGPWIVAALVAVDETLGKVYFTARGRERGRHPDYNLLYSVNLDGSALTLISPEDANHVVTPVPGGKYFVDAYSKVDTPPVIVVRGGDGRVVRELERADISRLVASGWKPGRPFTALARDGVTEITGVMYLPSKFDSTKSYPVIDHIYPGPLISPVPKSFFPTREAFSYSAFGQVQALAELGFVVVEIDALGNTGRSRATYQSWYGNMGDNGIPDHIAAIKQLAARHAWLDLSRVGIYGHSGGGFASTDALLRYPDFFQVAVSTSGNHDNRTYYYGWGERFQGLLVRDTLRKTDNYESAANKTIAKQLRGHLFLIHGDLDDNVHPAHTLQLVDALVKANKSFDLLILPDADHSLTQHPYVIRRTWDYFVEHLLGGTPPRDYELAGPPVF